MSKNRENRSNRIEKPTLWMLLGLWGLVFYTLFYFSLPSQLGFTDESGVPLPRWFDLTLLLLWEAMLAGMQGHGRFEIGIVDRLPILLGGLAWMTAAWWTGSCLVVNSVCLRTLSTIERVTLSVLVGLALLSTLTLGVGLAGGLASRWPLLGALTLVLILAGILRARSASQRYSSEATEPTNEGLCRTTHRTVVGLWAARLLPVATCMLVGIYILGSLVTPFEFDVVEYHLQAPKEFWQTGAIGFNGHNVYANMPLGAEMHSLAAMTLVGGEEGWWWGGLIGKFVIGSYSILGAALLGGFIARHFNPWTGWAAVALVLSAPGNAHVAIAGLIDIVVGNYVLAMLVVFSSLHVAATDSRDSVYGILLFSLCAGAAAACKYPGMLFAVLPMLAAVAWLMWRARVDTRTATKLALVTALGLGLTCAPWLMKNWVLTGSPVYPLAASLFGARGLSEIGIARWAAAHQVPVVGGSSYNATALLASMKQLWLTSPFLSPTLISLAAFGLLARAVGKFSCAAEKDIPPRWLNSWLVLTLWILAIWWLATHRIDRFWLSVLPLYAAFAAAGVAWIGSRISITLATGLVLVSVAYGTLLILSGTVGDNRFLVKLSELRNDAGDSEWPGRLSPATQWINENLSPYEDQVLLIGEARVFDFVPRVRYATCFNSCLAEQLLRGQSVEEQLENLRTAEISHLLVHWGEIRRYRSPGNYGFSDWPEREDLDALVASKVLEPVEMPFDTDLVELFRVRQ